MPSKAQRRAELIRHIDSLRVTDTPLRNHWKPTAAQREFLEIPYTSALYGGIAGGGKSVGLAFSASLGYCELPQYGAYRALIIAQTEHTLTQAGGVLSTLESMYPSVRYNAKARTMRFPNGAVIEFTTLPNAEAHKRIQGSQYSFIGIDEASHIPEAQLRYVYRSLRRSPALDIPLRMRLTSNPGGVGAGYLRREYVESANDATADNGFDPMFYLPSDYRANPYLDAESYEKSFARMSELDRQRFQYGNWAAQASGMFDTAHLIDFAGDVECEHWIRSWDFAASPSDSADYTVGALIGLRHIPNSQHWAFYISSIERFKTNWAGVTERVRATAERDGKDTLILIETEPGSSGLAQSRNIRMDTLGTYNCVAVKPTGAKTERAKALADAMGESRVYLRQTMRGRADLIEELNGFPDECENDDITDALSQAVCYARDKMQPMPDVWLSMKGLPR